VLPLVVLADLRLRQGRTEEAERLLAGLDDHPAALHAAVGLHLERGDSAVARALVDPGEPRGPGGRRAARAALPGRPGRRRPGRGGGRRRRAARVRRRACRARTCARRARWLSGRIAAAAGDVPAPPGAFEEAVERFGALEFPLEQARARLTLARVRAQAGSPLAPACARAARDAFDRLGARRDADEGAAALLRELGVAGARRPAASGDALTAREREVLRLISAGMSNGQIADRLVIAPKTAEHHVGRVLAKLGVRSRAEAAAHAVRQGL
jgi:DNA-binding CsgD family transcriptional regulator